MGWKLVADPRRTKEEILANNCMECNEKKIFWHVHFKHKFIGDMWFCCPECRDLWNEAHPESDSFTGGKITSGKKYCPDCKRLLTERITPEEGSVWFCKKCGDKDDTK